MVENNLRPELALLGEALQAGMERLPCYYSEKHEDVTLLAYTDVMEMLRCVLAEREAPPDITGALGRLVTALLDEHSLARIRCKDLQPFEQFVKAVEELKVQR